MKTMNYRQTIQDSLKGVGFISEFTMREHNIRPHADIEVDLISKQNGQVTFTLRINSGNIVDYAVVEYVNVEQSYGRLKKATPVVREKSNLSHNS